MGLRSLIEAGVSLILQGRVATFKLLRDYSAYILPMILEHILSKFHVNYIQYISILTYFSFEASIFGFQLTSFCVHNLYSSFLNYVIQ